MTRLLKKLLLLFVALIALNYISPNEVKRQSAATVNAAGQPITITYQKGDGKGAVSETDDGTLESRFVEGTLSRFSEYQGEGTENSLLLKRVLETSGGETIIETNRVVIKFPNIIGGGADQVPSGAKITSATLKLVMNAFSAPTALSASVYHVLEDWTETESGYLKSPGWRNRRPAENENDTTKQWTNFGIDTPTSSESPPIAEAVQIPNILSGTVSFDITKAVENWADGKPNNGVMLKLFQETPGGTLRLVSFYSSDRSETQLRPLLEVAYATEIIPPTPVPASTPTPAPIATPIPPTPIACTQEAKQCPDGSYVGRTGPNCEFTPCPTPPPPTPAPTPAPKPEPAKPTPKPAPTPTPMPVPAEPEKPTPAPTPETEEHPKPNIITGFFTLIQNRILETWESIIRLFR